jgi:hypothetical protein
MRFLVISKPKFPVPMEQLPMMMQGFAAWRARYRAQSDGFWFFAGDGGGAGVLNVPDEMTLFRIMAEYPFGLTSDVEVRAIVDGDWALAQWQEMLKSAPGG